jgi:hypothetical protein
MRITMLGEGTIGSFVRGLVEFERFLGGHTAS